MSTFPLRIGTPDGLLYEGEVARLVCRTINGDLAILPRHCNYCTALGMGEAILYWKTAAGRMQLYRRDAFCDEWNLPCAGNNLGVGRRYRYRESGRCQKTCGSQTGRSGLSDKEYRIVKAKLQRALVRLGVKE